MEGDGELGCSGIDLLAWKERENGKSVKGFLYIFFLKGKKYFCRYDYMCLFLKFSVRVTDQTIKLINVNDWLETRNTNLS